MIPILKRLEQPGEGWNLEPIETPDMIQVFEGDKPIGSDIPTKPLKS